MWLRRVLPYTTAGVLVAVIYAGWTIYSRWDAGRRYEQEAAARKLEFDNQTLKMIGTDLKISLFYANPAVIHAGAQVLLCYGVANAETVRIEPFVESITPSLSRCVGISPKKTMEYTLTAEDGAGHSVSQITIVKVQ